MGYRAWETDVGDDCDGRRPRCARRRAARFLPTVTIGDEKWVTERERAKLETTVTVGGQEGG